MTPPHEPAAAAFSADWLQLREPFDLAARATSDTQPQTAAALERLRAARAGLPWQVLDLGCGLGANLRALAPRLGGAQHWRVVDHDAALLAALPQALARWAQQQGHDFAVDLATARCRISGPSFSATVECRQLDLARDGDALPLLPGGLLTASALLDLVSAAWLQPLIARACRAGVAMWWALNVDGRLQWQPGDDDDAAVHALFSRHQQRDKGFLGAALGARAPGFALAQLAAHDYRSHGARSDWQLDGDAAMSMRKALLAGIAAAAREQDPQAEPLVRAWQARRAQRLGHGGLCVGHVDILATAG